MSVDLTLTGLGEAFRSGAVHPSDVTRTHLERIAKLDPNLGAFQAVYTEEAMHQARAADALFEAGYPLHPFTGIPFVLKDICDVAGRITTGGCPAMSENVATGTATIARRLLAAGGVLLGKTKTVECAFGGWGTNQHMGTPWNPWDKDFHRVPGGSSSGTGVAVASGQAICGVGTDTGGSVRLPAAFCGLVGLKVTEGYLPNEGILPLSHTLDTPGPMARSVQDALIMFLTMDGKEAATVDQNVEGLRFGVLDERERSACSVEVLEHYDAALSLLRGLGAVLVPIPMDNAEATQTCGRLIATEAWYHQGHLYSDGRLTLDEDVRQRMLSGRDVTAAEYLRLCETRTQDKARFLESMKDLHALVTPSVKTSAPKVEDIDQADLPGHFTRPINYYGMCAISVPSGVTDSGLPTSIQIAARAHEEMRVIGIAAAYEAVRDPITYPDWASHD